MKAETVFDVYRALNNEEQDRLYDLVKTHFKSKYNFKKSKKIKLKPEMMHTLVMHLLSGKRF